MSNPATGLAGDEVLSVLEAASGPGCWRSSAFAPPRNPEPLPTRPKPGRKDALSPAPAMPLTYLPSYPTPVHPEILEQLEQRGLPATRDSLVSALTKVIAPAGPVVRVAPNTFTVKGR